MSEKQPWNKETVRPLTEWSMPKAFDVQVPETGPQNQEPDVDHVDDPSLALTRMQENIAYIGDWKPFEMLELLKQKVDLSQVSIPWLAWFKDYLDLKV